MNDKRVTKKQLILKEYEENKDYYNTQYDYVRQISNKLKINKGNVSNVLFNFANNKNTLKKTKSTFNPFIKKAPKILFFDLENSPMLVEVFRLKQEYIHHQWIKKGSAILTWSAKWLYDTKMHYGYVTPRAANLRKDKKIIKTLWDLLDEADIVIAHNGKKFDRRVFNTRCIDINNNLDPPSSYTIVDTLLEARKEFCFASNTLDYLAKTLLENEKISTDGSLWRRCTDGTKEDAKKAISEMLKYNMQDVLLLEDLYIKLRPWIRSHPNLGMYYDDKKGRCGNCGSKKIKLSNKYYYTTTGKFKTIRCKECQTPYGRKRYQSDKKGLIIPTAR